MFENKEDNSQIKVIDFGLSKICYTKNTGKIERLKTKAGTPYYISPEVLNGHFDQKCDIWSLGVLLYVFMSGYLPF